MNKKILTLLLAASSIYLQGQEIKKQEKDTVKQLKEVVIDGKLEKKYDKVSSETVSKIPLKNIENPQVYNSVTSRLMKEQVVTNFNDAIKNATGVTRLWESTGRGGDGGEYYSMRGFSVQPTLINSLPALNNGFIDPINIETIEVVKGPSGTLFGSSVISYGGLINTITKRPHSKFGGEISYNAGSYGMDRVTADVNIPVNTDLAVRVTSAYQKQNSFQDAGFNRSFFIAPSLSYQVNNRVSFLVNTEFSNNNSANAPMIFLNRNAPLSYNSITPFENQYKKSFTSNDLAIENPTFNLQAQMFVKLSDNWTSQTALSRNNTKSNGYYSYLWDATNGSDFTRFISKRNGETYTTDIQQNFIGDFSIGKLRNRMVVGLDYFKSNVLNSSSGWVGNGVVNILDGSDTGDLTQAGVDALLVGTFEGNSDAQNEIYSAYISDVINILSNLNVMASVRIDHFASQANDEGVNDGQVAISPKFGIVYQPILNKLSVFANYMNGFKNVAPIQVSDADGTNQRFKTFDPEQANQLEFGVKTNLINDKLSLTASYYNITVSDRVITDPNNINNSIQGGEVVSKGIEISAIANPIAGLNIIAGYSHNNAEVTKDNPESGYLGLRPESAGPENLINFWTNYKIQNGSLKGFGVGFGGNYASEYLTLNRATTGSFALPSYTVINSALSYDNDKFGITLKLNNALNEKYFSGWSTITPQQLRSVIAGLTYKF